MDELTHPFPDPIRNHRAKVTWQDTFCVFYLDRNTELFECPTGKRTVAKVIAYVRAGHQDAPRRFVDVRNFRAEGE